MSTAEVRCRDGAKTLLPRSIPNLQLDSLAVDFHVLDLEVDSDGGDERWGEGVVSVTQQQARFAHAGVSDHEQLDLHVIGGCLAHCFRIMMLHSVVFCRCRCAEEDPKPQGPKEKSKFFYWPGFPLGSVVQKAKVIGTLVGTIPYGTIPIVGIVQSCLKHEKRTALGRRIV